ncbi:hypothetical protein H4219_006120, partial [Mycoemilia scoparia]
MTKGTKRALTLTSILLLALTSSLGPASVSANDVGYGEQKPHPDEIDGVKCLPYPVIVQETDNTKWETSDTYTLPEVPGTAAPLDKIDPDVSEMLCKLTIEEKVGQMMQIMMSEFMGCDGNLNKTALIDWMDNWKIGSILDVPSSEGGKYAWYTPPKLADVLDEIQEVATKHGSKIPILYGTDLVHGGNYIKGATIFPQSIGMAATFNLDLVNKGAKITAKDARVAGVPWVFAPILDLGVHKNWPRIYEGYGEDPLLVSKLANATVSGLQGNYRKDRNKVATSIKHFIAYGVPTSGLDRESRMVPDNTLMEYYVPPFEAAIKSGAATVMHSYSILNQESVVTSEYYLKELLREKLKFKGMMVTDMSEINNIINEHYTAGDLNQAIHQTMNYTSVDLSMIATDHEFGR